MGAPVRRPYNLAGGGLASGLALRMADGHAHRIAPQYAQIMAPV
jgi:hypothetical protein